MVMSRGDSFVLTSGNGQAREPLRTVGTSDVDREVVEQIWEIVQVCRRAI